MRLIALIIVLLAFVEYTLISYDLYLRLKNRIDSIQSALIIFPKISCCFIPTAVSSRFLSPPLLKISFEQYLAPCLERLTTCSNSPQRHYSNSIQTRRVKGFTLICFHYIHAILKSIIHIICDIHQIIAIQQQNGCISVIYNNFITMKTNFDISIPSIPSKRIKFKIQDIKNTAFGSQKNRFKEDKSFLTKKFIQSFNNFKEKQEISIPDTTETEAQSQPQFKIQRTELERRLLIPQEKKYMLHTYQKYKSYEAPILKETKYNRGYSFYKNDQLTQERKRAFRETSNSTDNKGLTDNYYFPVKRDRENIIEQAKKHSQPSCVFKNQTRGRVYSKLQKGVKQLPGPGAYELEPIKIKQDLAYKKHENQEENEIDLKKLRKLITNVVLEQDAVQGQGQEQFEAPQAKNNYVFVEDDRDRFGNYKYPIAFRLNVPGPGTYQIKESIENKTKKVVLVEQQRKLLKEWFNN